MKWIRPVLMVLVLVMFAAGNGQAATRTSIDVKDPDNREINRKCAMCHLKENKALVLQWEIYPMQWPRRVKSAVLPAMRPKRAMNWASCTKARSLWPSCHPTTVGHVTNERPSKWHYPVTPLPDFLYGAK